MGFGGKGKSGGKMVKGGKGKDGKGKGKGKGKGGKKGGKDGKGKGKGKGAPKAVVEVHTRFENVFVSKGRDDSMVTRSIAPGEKVYGEKTVIVEGPEPAKEKIEYRTWNPFRSKLGAGIVAGSAFAPKAGDKVLYLGAASGTTVSHVADMVGPTGIVYAVEFSHRCGRDLTNMAKKRPNVVPIVEDARQPNRYRMIVGAVDMIFSDVAQPDQTRIVALNAQMYLKNGGQFMISVKANCVDSTAAPEAVYESEVAKMKKEMLKPKEQMTLEPYHRDHALVCGEYKPAAAKKATA